MPELDAQDRDDLRKDQFAYVDTDGGEHLPINDETHVRNAIARFDQTVGVSDEDRKLAFANIKKAANHYGVEMSESDWHELGKHPSTGRTAEDRKKSAQKAAETRKEHEHHKHH